MKTDEAIALAAGILDRAGIADVPLDVSAMRGGGNNRVFRVDCRDGRYVLKRYFQSGASRDRLASDFGFAAFAWQNGIEFVPQPIGANSAEAAGLYEFVEGRRLAAAEITARVVNEAGIFCARLNEHRRSAAAASLAAAAEACFTVAEHVACIDARAQRLKQLDLNDPLGQRAEEFVQSALLPKWREIREEVLARFSTAAQANRSLATDERCLSPSDFGFHNAILQQDGRIRFFDFEYAGWDDPAKLLCDFFCQPEVPVPLDHFDLFAQSAFAGLTRTGEASLRARLLLPAYRIKWCCIMLNNFLPAENQRRRFADPDTPDAQRKALQLERAAALLRTVSVQSLS